MFTLEPSKMNREYDYINTCRFELEELHNTRIFRGSKEKWVKKKRERNK